MLYMYFNFWCSLQTHQNAIIFYVDLVSCDLTNSLISSSNFLCYKVRPFKVLNSVCLSVLTELCKHKPQSHSRTFSLSQVQIAFFHLDFRCNSIVMREHLSHDFGSSYLLSFFHGSISVNGFCALKKVAFFCIWAKRFITVITAGRSTVSVRSSISLVILLVL